MNILRKRHLLMCYQQTIANFIFLFNKYMCLMGQWISVDELLSQQFYKEDEMLKRVMEICMATYEKNYSGFVAHQVTSKFDGKMSYLYYKDDATI